jgi:UDP-N-acetylglucosamine acyltransferase
MIGGCSKITMDVMPYALSDGNPQKLDGLNILGLKRKGFSDAEIRVAKEMYKTLFLEGAMVWGERLAAAEKVYGDSPIARRIFDFIGGVSRRPLARPRKKFLGLGDA